VIVFDHLIPAQRRAYFIEGNKLVLGSAKLR